MCALQILFSVPFRFPPTFNHLLHSAICLQSFQLNFQLWHSLDSNYESGDVLSCNAAFFAEVRRRFRGTCYFHRLPWSVLWNVGAHTHQNTQQNFSVSIRAPYSPVSTQHCSCCVKTSRCTISTTQWQTPLTQWNLLSNVANWTSASARRIASVSQCSPCCTWHCHRTCTGAMAHR